ncbi:MAG: glycerophosphodiester phosphodiesterase [Anaerolineae bacterium]|nr:glycerophosphodiester phosphodiesterase [Anaerolineae bacterium]
MSIVRTSPVLPPEARPAWDSLLPVPKSLVSDRQTLIIGHRGARGLAPENTLVAFQVAADLRIDGVEFDAQRTKDGHLVVFHDENVARVTPSEGLIPEMTLAEVKALDAGIKFDPRFSGEPVPTLDEAFAFLRQTDLLLFLELKEPWRFPGIEAQIIEAIRRYDLVERIQLRAFYHDALHIVHKLAPEISLSELWLDRIPNDDEVTLKTIDVLHTLYTPENIAHIHARGQQATAWTVNELDDARRLIAAGLDAIATDFPDRMLALSQE